MVRPFAHVLLRVVIVCATAASLLSGCGRKGPLELPPSSQAAGSENAPAAQPGSLIGGSLSEEPASAAASMPDTDTLVDASTLDTSSSRANNSNGVASHARLSTTRDGYPIAPPGEKRSLPGDWLID